MTTEKSRLLNNNNNYSDYDIEDNDEYVITPTDTTNNTINTSINNSKYYFSLTSLINKTDNDDLITLETKKLYFIITITILLWLLSFILIIYYVINDIKIDNYDIYLFIPMWLGTIISIIKIITMIFYICSNPNLVPRERSTRLFMITYNKTNNNNNNNIDLNNDDNNEIKFIDYDSLPLMRRLFCSSFLILISLILIMITQILFSLYYIYQYNNIYHTIIPIIILFCLFILYSTIIKAASLQTCAIFTLIFIQFVSFIIYYLYSHI